MGAAKAVEAAARPDATGRASGVSEPQSRSHAVSVTSARGQLVLPTVRRPVASGIDPGEQHDDEHGQGQGHERVPQDVAVEGEVGDRHETATGSSAGVETAVLSQVHAVARPRSWTGGYMWNHRATSIGTVTTML